MIVEVLGLVIAVGVMIIVIVRRQLQKNRINTQVNLEDSATQIQLQLEEVADKVIKRIDNRIDHLELLIQEADDKINLLDDKLKLPDVNDKVVGDQPLPVAQHSELLTRSASSVSLSDADSSAEDLPAKRDLMAKRVVFESKTNQMVIALLDSGHDLDEIAKKTGIGKGAILLIKEMHKF